MTLKFCAALADSKERKNLKQQDLVKKAWLSRTERGKKSVRRLSGSQCK